MIRTRVVEATMRSPGQVEETDLGYCLLPEVPVEKVPPQPPKAGEMPPQPLVIKIDGAAFFVIGHTWDLTLVSGESTSKEDLSDHGADATLVLVVQRVPPMPSGLVQAGADAMNQIERLMPPPGGANGGTH